MRFAGDVLVEAVEDFRQMLLDDRPECPKRLTCRGVKPKKARSGGEIAWIGTGHDWSLW